VFFWPIRSAELPRRSAERAADGYIVAAMTELITVGPPVAVALGVAIGAALVVRRLAFAKRDTGE
jgi:hypothetical protein